MTVTRFGAALLLTAILVTGCGGSSSEEPPRSQGAAESGAQTSGKPATSGHDAHEDEGHEAPAEEAPEPSPGYVATGAPSVEGRRAPNVRSGPLAFTKVFVARSAAGKFALQANATNKGRGFVNDAEVAWAIEGAGGKTLASGTVTIAALAPGETTSVAIETDARYDETWRVVRLDLL